MSLQIGETPQRGESGVERSKGTDSLNVVAFRFFALTLASIRRIGSLKYKYDHLPFEKKTPLHYAEELDEQNEQNKQTRGAKVLKFTGGLHADNIPPICDHSRDDLLPDRELPASTIPA